MKSCVVGESGPKPGAVAGAGDGAPGDGAAAAAGAGAAAAAGPAAWAGSIPPAGATAGRLDARCGHVRRRATGGRDRASEPAHRERGPWLNELVHRRGHVLGLGGCRRVMAGECLRGGHQQLRCLLRVARRLLDYGTQLRQGRQARQLLSGVRLRCRLRCTGSAAALGQSPNATADAVTTAAKPLDSSQVFDIVSSGWW